MGLSRPVFNDFSAGALTPKLFGRTNSAAYAAGAKVMRNMVPQLFGSAKRRGGFQYITELSGISGTARIIPWSVSDTIDVLVILSDDQIDLFDVSTGHTPGIIYTITALSENNPSYTEAELYEVNYASGIRNMYFAHKNHPLFRIGFLNYEADTTTFTFDYGTVQLGGSIAYTPEIDETVSTASDVLVAATLCSAMDSLPANTTVNVTASTSLVNGLQVASLRRNVVAASRNAEIYTTNWLGSYKISETVVNGASTIPLPFVSPPTVNIFVRNSEKSVDKLKYSSPFPTRTKFLDDLAGLGLTSGVTLYMEYKDAALIPNRSKGTVIFNSVAQTTSYLITFVGGTTLTITPASSSLTGYINDPDGSGIVVNKGVTGGAAALDNLVPWMVPGTPYECDSTIRFMDIYPTFATKNEGYRKYDDETGAFLEEVPPSLTVQGTSINTGGATKTLTITRETMATGQLGVIVNPFIGGKNNPAFVGFHNGRMVVGGSIDEPNVVYLSKVNDYTNFCYFDEVEYEQNTIRAKPWTNPNIPEYDVKKAIVQQIGQNSAMRLELLTDESEALKWVASMGDLIIGTATSEWVIPGGVTAHNPRAVLTSRNGSSAVQGRFVKGSILFASANANSLKLFQATQGEVTEAITEQAEHLFRMNAPIRSFDFRQDPYFGIVAQMDTGVALLGVVNGQSVGWCEVDTEGDIESIAVIAAADEDAVYAVIERTDQDGAYLTLERLRTTDDGTASYTDRIYLDSWVHAQSSGAGAVSGALRFANQSDVYVVFSTGVHGTPVINDITGVFSTYTTVEDGVTVTHNNPLSTWCVFGFLFESELQTLRVDSMEIEGLSKQPGGIHFRVYESGDFKLKHTRTADTSMIDAAVPTDEDGNRIYPYSGAIRIESPDSSAVDQYVHVYTKSHEPLTIQMISPFYDVGEAP